MPVGRRKNIRFTDDSILTDGFSFNKLQFQNENTVRLAITDNNTGKFVVLSENEVGRESVEKNIRQYLGLQDSETIRALLNKSERLGFSEAPVQKQFRDYLIERDTQNTFTVMGGDTAVRLDLTDKETARKSLRDTFGMSSAKADRIITKAAKQSVTENMLKKIKSSSAVNLVTDTLKHKSKDRGSRS